VGELFNKEERQNLSRVVVRRSKIVLKKFLGQNFSIEEEEEEKREKKFTKFLRSQEFQIIRIQSQKDVFKTNIVVIHDQIPQIFHPNPPFLRSRPHPKSIISSSRRRRHDAFVSFSALLMNQSFFFFNKREVRFLFFF